MGKSSDSGQRYAAEMSRETARDTTYADRPDVYLPFGLGRQTWETYEATDPATGDAVTRWRQKQELDPDIETVYRNQLNNAGLLSGLESNLGFRAAANMLNPYDWDQFGDPINMQYDPTELRQRAEDAAYQKEANRLNARFGSEAEQMEIKLRNQGLRPGDQAYDSAMESFGRTRNDAYEQARLGAVGIGRQEAGQLYDQQYQSTELANALRDKSIQEYLGRRNQPLKDMQSIGSLEGISELAQVFGGGATA